MISTGHTNPDITSSSAFLELGHYLGANVEGKKLILKKNEDIKKDVDQDDLTPQGRGYLKRRNAKEDRDNLNAMKDVDKDEKSNTNIFQTQNNNQNNTNEFNGGNMVAAKDNPYAVIG